VKEIGEFKPRQNIDTGKKIKAFENTKNDVKGPEHINTINQDKEGTVYNGVPYEKKVFRVQGKKVEGVFPQFKSDFDTILPRNLLNASDIEQFKYATEKLRLAIECNPDLARNFTPRQLEQIKNGRPKIEGKTWHHNEIPGIMQLVDEDTHRNCRHTGGRNIWGGGSGYR
jgi:hypothetical protein